MNLINKNHRIATGIAPTSFAFGGGTKPISELMFNKYDIDKSGKSPIEVNVELNNHFD